MLVPGRILRRRFAGFKIKLWWSVVCVRITNIRPDFPDVQDTNRSFSQQCRVRSHFAGRRFVNGRDASITIAGLRVGNIHTQVLGRSVKRQCRERQSHFQSDNHMSIDVVDHVPSNSPRQLTSSQVCLHIFEDKEAVIRMIIKGRSPCWSHVSRTYHVDLDCMCSARST